MKLLCWLAATFPASSAAQAANPFPAGVHESQMAACGAAPRQNWWFQQFGNSAAGGQIVLANDGLDGQAPGEPTMCLDVSCGKDAKGFTCGTDKNWPDNQELQFLIVRPVLVGAAREALRILATADVKAHGWLSWRLAVKAVIGEHNLPTSSAVAKLLEPPVLPRCSATGGHLRLVYPCWKWIGGLSRARCGESCGKPAQQLHRVAPAPARPAGRPRARGAAPTHWV